jgi:hypothetical protein
VVCASIANEIRKVKSAADASWSDSVGFGGAPDSGGQSLWGIEVGVETCLHDTRLIFASEARLNRIEESHGWGTKHRGYRKVAPLFCLKFRSSCSIQTAYLTSRWGVSR